MINCELLAPAGNMESLKVAADCGADAVYLGGSAFNARASAGNFNNEELKLAVDYCHLRKVKVYVAVNILVSDREFAELDKFIRYINKIGVDGVIVQDMGVAMYIKNIAPDLKLHASTQMTVYDTEGAKFLKGLGFERVVLARELSKEQIAEITQKSGIDTEIFVHGAMCVCYSGQCLMSSMIGGRSGNRGKCAQPCRLQYKIDDKQGYLMSLKDMCLIKYLKDFNRYGVASLKIEGRMKGPEYVGAVVSIYRKYLDSEDYVSDSDYNMLESIFYRGGLSDGYYKSSKGRNMFCHTKPDNPYLKQNEKAVLKESYKKTKIYIYFEGYTGKPLKMSVVDEYNNCAEYTSQKPLEKATNTSSSAHRVKEQLSKLGDTVFSIGNVEINISDDVFIPTSEINAARRHVTSKLQEIIIDSYRRDEKAIKFNSPVFTDNCREFEYSVSVTDKNQLEAIRKTDCKRIYAPLELKEYFNGSEVIMLPRISPDNLQEQLSIMPNTDVLVRNIGHIEIAKRCNKNIHIDFSMNVFNRFSCQFYKDMGVRTITLSAELMLNQIKGMTDLIDCEAVIYGKIPLMITENCIIKSSAGCKHGGYIEDRTNEKFLVKCLPECRNEIYNSKPVMMSDKIDDIKSTGLKYGRLSFIDESADECVKIYNSYKDGVGLNIEFTRGKFYKGV